MQRVLSRAVAVYMYLKSRTDKDKSCFLSTATIAEALSLSRRTGCRGPKRSGTGRLHSVRSEVEDERGAAPAIFIMSSDSITILLRALYYRYFPLLR